MAINLPKHRGLSYEHNPSVGLDGDRIRQALLFGHQHFDYLFSACMAPQETEKA